MKYIVISHYLRVLRLLNDLLTFENFTSISKKYFFIKNKAILCRHFIIAFSIFFNLYSLTLSFI